MARQGGGRAIGLALRPGCVEFDAACGATVPCARGTRGGQPVWPPLGRAARARRWPHAWRADTGRPPGPGFRRPGGRAWKAPAARMGTLSWSWDRVGSKPTRGRRSAPSTPKPVIATRPSVTLPALPCRRGRPRTCGLGVGGPLPPWDRGFESPACKPAGDHRARAAAHPDAPDRCTSPHRRARQTRLGGRAGPARSGGGAWQLENREWRYRADGGNSRSRPAGGGPGTDGPRLPHAPVVTAGWRYGRRA